MPLLRIHRTCYNPKLSTSNKVINLASRKWGDKPIFSLLPSSKHNEKVDFIAVLDGFNEFIGVGSRMIYKNLNDV